MQFAFLGKQVLRVWMAFHVFEGLLSLFLYLVIKGIFISEQSGISLYAQFSFELECVIFNIFLWAILVSSVFYSKSRNRDYSRLSLFFLKSRLLFFGTACCRVRTGPGNPGKSWNFILAFSRTGKSWKSLKSCNKVFFKNNCLQYYFRISI